MMDQSAAINKSPSKAGFIIVLILLVLVTIFTWASFTKHGYIPNFLNISFLNVDDSHILDQPLDETTDFDASANNKNGKLDLWKPVIYLYPAKTTAVNVKLDYKGEIIADYPDYDRTIKGWNVVAHPDGKIINQSDGREYSYIFWEGNLDSPVKWDLSSGFVVKGSATKDFLLDTLPKIGLSAKEYNEFIVYWYPLMKDNNYNFIHFSTTEYDKAVPLIITPKPDSILRVFMLYKPLDSFVNVKKQQLLDFDRRGFTVVEWGGTEIK